jgi:hypothetical protein
MKLKKNFVFFFRLIFYLIVFGVGAFFAFGKQAD